MISRAITKQGNLPNFRILSNGIELGRGDFAVNALYVARHINKITTATLELIDGNIPDETFPTSDKTELAPGAEIEIQLGYLGKETKIFKGLVIKHGLRSNNAASSILSIELKDATVKMTVGRKNRYFQKVSDAEIIEELLADYGLKKKVELSRPIHKEMVQYHCTDWDFLLSRADAIGKLVFLKDGLVEVKQPKFVGLPKLDLVYGQNVVDFEMEMDARTQYATITGKAWDFSKQQIIESESRPSGFKEQGNLKGNQLSEVIGLDSLPVQHTGNINPTELQQWTDARLLRSRLSKIQGWVRIYGYTDIEPGDLVKLSGMGERFNGTAYVTGVGHTYGNESTWYTDIQVGLCQKWATEAYEDIADQPAAGLLPAISGLQIGIVTAIHGDPDGEHRIKVRIPIINEKEEGVWARVSNLDAGNARGTFFRPELEDEVIVGFLNDDPRNPIILGMVHSSAKPAPIEATEENNEKGIITRSEMKLIFDDDKISFRVQTPNGNIFSISDEEGSINLEDENGNKITMNDKGIHIESGSDLNFKATGDIVLEGANITNTATGNYKSEGNAGVELSSSANAVIKGALVQIN